MASKVVLITGPTGRIGKDVVARLSANKGFVVRAAVHSANKAAHLKDLGAHEVVEFDYKNPETWAPACKDVSVVYSASLDPLLEHHFAFCDYLGTKKTKSSMSYASAAWGQIQTQLAMTRTSM